MSTRQEQAVNGFTFGKLGQIVFFKWNGKVCQRAYVIPSNPNTEKQQLVRQRMSVLGKTATGMQSVINVGLHKVAKSHKSTTIAEFVSLNQAALTGSLDNLELDYESLVVAKGGLPGVEADSPNFTTPLTITTSVTNGNASFYGASITDKLYLAAYCPDVGNSVCSNGTALRPADGNTTSLSVTTPSAWQGCRAYVWIFAVRADGQKASDSIYLGYGNIS